MCNAVEESGEETIMTGTGELCHVRAEFGHNDPRRGFIHTGNRAEISED
jgi:hypothetical protein